ncbi:MAG: alpha/beta hydrolase family protein [Planctomycetota bacterium]|jgi:cephalosporin-C deacetylase-like acetyl esterase
MRSLLLFMICLLSLPLTNRQATARQPSGTEDKPQSQPPMTPWKISDWKKVPEFTWLDQDSRIRSLTYRSEPYQGVETDVFAFYATPGTISGNKAIDKDLPAVVLIHGGGGTAFADWVWLWARRGYAAIAMDLSGRRPESPRFNTETGELISNLRASRTRLKRGGPEADHVSKFQNAGGDLSDDWQPHSVAAVMRAHSLIRSFDEVNAHRTAVTGISWGGYMTCLVASLDDRFKAAVPVYGCGFLYEGESVQKPMIDRLSDEQRREWIRIYDPSAWLPQCRVPVLFVNGTNDKHYPLNSYLRSYNLVPGPKQIRIEAGMRHSHVHGWNPIEIGLFIDQRVNGGVPLPAIGEPLIKDGKATASLTSRLPIKHARLHYTPDSGPLVSRKWQSIDAAVVGESITATLPNDATIWMLTVTDTRDAMVSTRVQFAE